MTEKINYTRTDDSIIATVGKHTITLNFAEISDKVIKPLVLRGATDKTRDRHAGAAAKGLTVDEIAAIVKESFENFRNGIFDAGRSGVSGTTILAEAIARVQKISIVDAKGLVEKLDDEQLKAVNANAKVKAAILEIKAERAKEIVSDDDESLDTLLGL